MQRREQEYMYKVLKGNKNKLYARKKRHKNAAEVVVAVVVAAIAVTNKQQQQQQQQNKRKITDTQQTRSLQKKHVINVYVRTFARF